MIIKLKDHHLQKAKDFAHDRMVDRKLYFARGSFKYIDLIVGVLAEFGAVKYLRHHGWSTSNPDLNIYDKKAKSYAADLEAIKEEKQMSFHVKGQSKQQQGKPWANSWLLQKNDPLVSSQGYKHALICCIVDINQLEVEILGCVNSYSINKNNLYKTPVKPSLQSSKVAIYWEDLKFFSKSP